MMRDAQTPAELWRYIAIFSKIVDGRSICKEFESAAEERPMNYYGSTFIDFFKNRIKSWKENGRRSRSVKERCFQVFTELSVFRPWSAFSLVIIG